MNRLIALTFCLILIGTNLYAQETKKSKRYEFGVGIGFLGEGEAYLAEPDVDVDMSSSILARFFVDAYLTPKFAFGGFFNYAAPDVADEATTMIEFGISLKPKFTPTPEVTIKPGLYLGYRTYTGDFYGDDVVGLGLNFGVEFQYNLKKEFIPFLEIGFITQPAGGNDETDVTYNPVFYMLVGAAF